jgi:kynurenine formamidase
VLKTNWGRWSADDQLGTLNLITPERVLGAISLVRDGQVVSLGQVLRHGMLHHEDRLPPMHVLTVDGGDYAAGARTRSGGGAQTSNGACVADDYLAMPLATGTHLDGLAHVWGEKGLYNGHSPSAVRSRGARVCGIENVQGIVTRGLLADVAAYRGVESLPASHCIVPEEIEGSLGGVEPRPGDALLIRTGWLDPANVRASGMEVIQRKQPGIGMAAVEWVAEQDISLVGCDNFGIEVLPPEDPATGMPVHVALLSGLGVYMMELLQLGELAASGRREFLLVIAPLKIRGGINSPVNPLAVL